MTNEQVNQEQETQQVKTNDKELNFRTLQARYEKQLADERAARQELENKIKASQHNDDDDGDEPYVDHKRLNKKLMKFNESTQGEITKAMEFAKQQAKEELKQELWLEGNPDFYDVLKHADKFANEDPKLAETILRMPEGFERQKLVYYTIKSRGIDKPAQKQSSVQEKIDANRRSPYYQPSGVGTPGYSSQGDFSASGQKNAYDKLQELKKNLRL